MDAALRLRGVTKRFGDKLAVDNLDLEIPRGSMYGFLGQNGAGKTTTIRMIMSILLPDSGTIEVLGAHDALAVKDRLGYLPEEKGLYRKMRVLDVLAYFGRLKGLPAAEARRRAEVLLVKYGLGHALKLKCEALSKGMGQKVQILGTLIHEPDLVILDEPFSGLDPTNQDVLNDLLADLKARGTTVIFSTHTMEKAERLCDYVVMIHHGRKCLDGTLDEVLGEGSRAIQLDYAGDESALQGLPGVVAIGGGGSSVELTLADDADAQAVLQQLVGRVKIRRFDVRRPSLHQVFVKIADDRGAA